MGDDGGLHARVPEFLQMIGDACDRIALALRRASDTAVPNRRFVSLADTFLKRDGRMLAALDGMGANRIAAECVPFFVDGHHAPLTTDRAA